MTQHRHEKEIRELDRLAYLMDSFLRIPGTKIRIGLDSLIGFIPGLGDGASAAPSLYIILRTRHLGVPWPKLAYMVWIAGVDLLIGTVPLLGDVFDIGFKANQRNVEIIIEHLADKSAAPPTEGPSPAA